MIAIGCTAIVVAVFAIVVIALRDTGSSGASTAFPLSTVDGVALVGKTTLIWFTDSSCPDGDGVARTARLDDELGGQALRVVIVLVNVRQPGPQLGQWRAAFGRPDWIVAPDQGGRLSTAVKLRALETKFLLDARGSVLDERADLVTDTYVNLLREKARG